MDRVRLVEKTNGEIECPLSADADFYSLFSWAGFWSFWFLEFKCSFVSKPKNYQVRIFLTNFD